MKQAVIVICFILSVILCGCDTPVQHTYVIEWDNGDTEAVVGTSYKSYVMNKSGVVVVKIYDYTSHKSFYGNIKSVKTIK